MRVGGRFRCARSVFASVAEISLPMIYLDVAIRVSWQLFRKSQYQLRFIIHPVKDPSRRRTRSPALDARSSIFSGVQFSNNLFSSLFQVSTERPIPG